MFTVLLGGARSGKSSLAVELGRRQTGPVTFIATCPPFDGDLSERIARHRAERPAWPTIEEPIDVAGALERAAGTFVILDCLTLWVSNLLHRGDDDETVDRLATTTVEAARRHGDLVVITNEVGLGVHPETALGRRYRDVLGRVNQAWVAAADSALLLVAGRALPLDDPWRMLT